MDILEKTVFSHLRANTGGPGQETVVSVDEIAKLIGMDQCSEELDRVLQGLKRKKLIEFEGDQEKQVRLTF
jgi:RIO-like serine/threonine protein kinase